MGMWLGHCRGERDPSEEPPFSKITSMTGLTSRTQGAAENEAKFYGEECVERRAQHIFTIFESQALHKLHKI